MAEVKVISKKKKLIVTFIIMLILVFLFNRAMYWTEFSTWKNKVMVAVISLTGVIGMPLFLTYVKSVSDYIDMFINNKSSCFIRKTYIKQNIWQLFRS